MGPNEETGVPLAFIQTSEITLTGTFRYANTYRTAIDLAATGKVDLDAMVTSHFALAETEEALQASGKRQAYGDTFQLVSLSARRSDECPSLTMRCILRR
jgi:threonine dehydrogenase-like Zn-dependent dehydrogenase